MGIIEDKYEFKTNTIYRGDNLHILPDFPSESIDLIYIDPPFSSNKAYNIIWGNGYEKQAYDDRWDGKIEAYIEWMKKRIVELYRLLKPSGSFYLHCDYRTNAHFRLRCDEIFGENNFRNEIIWRYPQGIKASSKKFLSNHDNILFYTKSDEYTFNKQINLYTENQLNRFNCMEDDGRKYYFDTRRGKNGEKKKVKVYLKKKGTPVGNVWYYNRVQGKERTGYPTQKPEVLLERIIKASSNEKDIVLDAFCGGGTTLVVAKRLKRKWIGIDISPRACRVMAEKINYRLQNIVGMKYTNEQLDRLTNYEYQCWAVRRIGGIPNPKETSDYGEDGWKYIKGKKHPIEVKRTSVGRPVIQKFESVVRRSGTGQGFVIGDRFPKTAIEEISRINNIGEIRINYFTREYLRKMPPIKKPEREDNLTDFIY